MKKDLLKSLALVLVLSAFSACSSSSDDGDDGDDNGTDPVACVITQTSALTSIQGAAYTAACTASNASTCVATGDVNVSTLGSYPLAFTAQDCNATAGVVTIVEDDTVDPGTPIENVLPF